MRIISPVTLLKGVSVMCEACFNESVSAKTQQAYCTAVGFICVCLLLLQSVCMVSCSACKKYQSGL